MYYCLTNGLYYETNCKYCKYMICVESYMGVILIIRCFKIAIPIPLSQEEYLKYCPQVRCPAHTTAAHGYSLVRS